MDLLEFMMDLDILVLFGPEKYDPIYKRIRYLVGVNSGVTSVTTHNFAKCIMYLIYFV